MSSSTRSKPASPTSPATGDETATEAAAPAPSDTTIELESPRHRLISWTIFWLVLGALLVWKLGTVGVWAGWAVLALGLYRGFQLAMALIYPAGAIVVSAKRVVLPRHLHRPRPLEVAPSEIGAVYFLRRSVPLYHAAPVLVVEVGGRALLYPRDWFATEADQRHVVHALLRDRA